MDKPEYQTYRDQLASELMAAPRDIRKAMLQEARQSEDYIFAMLDHTADARNRKYAKEASQIIENEPNLEFDLDNLIDLKQKLFQAAEYLYETTTAYNREGGYDPQKGHMLCGEITDRFIAYLKRKGVESRRVDRTYEVKSPDGTYYDESYGHVYLTIDREQDHTLVDPTYLQFVEAEERQSRDPVLVIRYKDKEDFKIQFQEVPIKKPMVLPFYLGFDSPETKDFFKDSNYTILSEDRMRLDD